MGDDEKVQEFVNAPQVLGIVPRLLHFFGRAFPSLLPLGLLGIHLFWTSHTEFARRAELWSYEKLVQYLPSPSTQLPIVVVDYGENFQIPGTESTDLRQIVALIDEVSRHNPAAIGVDVVLGGRSSQDVQEGRYPPGQEALVQKALELRARGIAVYVVIKDGLANPDPATWLGEPDSRLNRTRADGRLELVAHAFAPKPGPGGFLTLFGDLRVPDLGDPERDRIVPSLAGALASAYLKRHGEAPLDPKPNWLLEPYAEPIMVEASLGEAAVEFPSKRYYLNFGALPALTTIRVRTPQDVDGKWPSTEEPPPNAIFLLGSADPNRDSAPGPFGDRGGLLLHAIGTYTLLFAPVSTFAFGPHLVLDLLLLAAVLFTNTKLRKRLEARRPQAGSTIATIASATLVAVFTWLPALGLAYFFRILWMDWLLVVAILFIDCLVHLVFEAYRKDRVRLDAKSG